MIIHSKYKDYYDSALAHGVDTSVHWVRNVEAKVITTYNSGYYSDSKPPSAHPFFESEQHKKSPSSSERGELHRRIIYVGFCGKVYTGIQFEYTKSLNNIVTTTVYSANNVVKVLEEYDRINGKQSHAKSSFLIKEKDGRSKLGWPLHGSDWNYDIVDSYFKQFNGSDKFHNIFVDENVPIWVIDENARIKDIPMKQSEGVLYTNPCLADYDFQTVFDSYTAMQEVEMFLSGVLGTGNPEIVEIADKYKIAGHGYTQCSFRKAPTKRKNKCSMKKK